MALFLSPWKNEETIDSLFNLVQKAKIDWGRLLFMANLHFCAPLWFCRLQKDGLLPLLPSDLQIYLKHLYQANLKRQDAFRQAIIEIVSSAHNMEIPIILLKGATTFCDNLYEDNGARMMGDIDLLVKKQHIESAKKIMWELGYEEQPDSFGKSVGIYGSRTPHHLPRYLKLETPVAVEIHFQTARAQADKTEALRRLARTGSSNRVFTNRDVEAMIGLIEKRPCYEIIFSDLNQAVSQLKRHFFNC